MTTTPPRCSVEGCSGAYYAKGYCQTHYARMRRRGTLDPVAYANRTMCSVEGCNRMKEARGWCFTHYMRWRRHGDPAFVNPKHRVDGKAKERNNERVARWARDNPARWAFNQIRKNAKQRGKAWALLLDEVAALITAPCHYCGAAPDWPRERNGIDRVDNAEGYVAGNCVPCCAPCNTAKGTKSVAEFEDWIRRAHTHLTNRRVPALRVV